MTTFQADASVTEKQTQARRAQFVRALNEMDAAWMAFLQDVDFLDINYSDLFTGLWSAQRPVRKQEAVEFMRHLGMQTAKKYLDRAIAKGHVVEINDPEDGRAKLIMLSEPLKDGLEHFFDRGIALFSDALAE